MRNLFFLFFTIVLFNSCEKEPFNAWPASPCFKWEETEESRIPNFTPSGLKLGEEYRIYCKYDIDTTSFGSRSCVATQFQYDIKTDINGIINYVTCQQQVTLREAQKASFVFYKCDKYGHIVENLASWNNGAGWNTESKFSLKINIIY